MITTAAELIDALGGTKVVEKLCEVGKTAVSNWRVDDAIPGRHFVRVWRYAKEKKVEFDPAIFDRRQAS